MSDRKDKFEKVKEELTKAFDDDPNTIFVEMDFPNAKALAKYLDLVDKFLEESKNSKIIFKN
jgi:hypothetical protein